MSLKDFSAKDHLVISTLGLEFALAEILGCALGLWLDKKWDTTPWMLFLGAAGGFTLGMYRIIRFAREMDRQEKIAAEKKKNGRY